jgi:hypothetical protein
MLLAELAAKVVIGLDSGVNKIRLISGCRATEMA